MRVRTLGKLGLVVSWLIATALAWSLAFSLVVRENVGVLQDFWAPERLLAYGAFLVAPALTFAPLGRLVRVPFLEIEAIAGWSTSLFVWTFIDPERVRGPLAMLVVLLPLLVSVSSVFTLLSAAVELRLAARHAILPDPLRARRRGYVLGLFSVGCLLLHSLGALTAINVGLLALITLLVELLAMTWFAPVREIGDESSGSTRDRRRRNEYGRGAPRPR
uniref:Uncharacterized protein n=1 Tax=Thermomicrobium roseum TaxID=500 RepID=A0A7C1XDS4_THERO